MFLDSFRLVENPPAHEDTLRALAAAGCFAEKSKLAADALPSRIASGQAGGRTVKCFAQPRGSIIGVFWFLAHARANRDAYMPNAASGFAGMRVAAFESRRAAEMAGLIERFGGVASVSPSMREVAIAENRDAIDFAHRVMTGQIDIIIFMTGVGIRHLLAEVERHVDRQRLLSAISDITTIVRGPKPAAVLKELGLTATYRVPEPNTWREVLATVDQHVNVAQQTVGLQEYGQPNASLVAGLEARGAHVLAVKVYRWDLPLDLAPLESNVRALAAGEVDVAMFTSSHQVVNLLRMAERLQLTDPAPRHVAGDGGFDRADHQRNAPRVRVPRRRRARTFEDGAARGRRRREGGPSAPPQAAASVVAQDRSANPASGERLAAAARGPWDDGPFMKACRREPVDRVPIWLMRQAGRYMTEYRAVREKTTFLELCKNPALAAEVMITAVNRLGVDAAIIFADLLPILEPMGLELEFTSGDGPVIHNPLRAGRDVERFLELDSVGPLDFVMQTVRLTRAGVPPSIPLIGFAGAPFTLASYAIEGGASRNYTAHQVADAPRRRRVGRHHGTPGPRGDALFERPDRRRRAGRATVR